MLVIVAFACNNIHDDDGHIVGMSKMAKLHKAQQNVKRALDSIAVLPVKTQQAAAEYVAALNKAAEDLNYADFAMEKWMTEYNPDSSLNDKEKRLQYLHSEQMKVDKMKNAILNSLQKADSILQITK
ncbi:MAG: hypothetical protein IPL04_14515 [Chitinophagaceae bacterium]|nr:hypothetical protein [Chitinophagaceae bacterium]